MTDSIVDRIQREAGIPDLLEILAERLAPTDLQSLLLAVYRRRAAAVSPARLLERYQHDRFVRPAESDPMSVAELERLACMLLPTKFQAIELSPVCPLGTNSAVASVDQNNVLTTIRNNEVVSDLTNVLALECAVHRRQLLQADPRSRERVRLAASHRLVRAQAYDNPNARPHFRLLGLCTAGRDEGSFRFETAALVEQIDFYLRLLRAATSLGYRIASARVDLTDLTGGRREETLQTEVLAPLRAAHAGSSAANEPEVICGFDPDRASGRGYYVDACFHVYAINAVGIDFELVDGGFTTWTQQLLGNAKERLLISGMGHERLSVHFRSDHPPATS